MIIFGISIGTMNTGVCVLQDGHLLDRHIHKFSTSWSEAKFRIIMKRYRQYLQKYSITAIVIKVPPVHKHTKAIARILKGIEALAKEYYCEFDLFTKSELKSITCMRSTDELIEYTKRLYPGLATLHKKGTANRHSYYKKMFEAILSAHVYQERQIVRAVQLERSRE